MERVKELNEKYNDKGEFFGETSRSDMLEEELANLFVRPEREMLFSSLKEKRGMDENENHFPQPKLAKNHTADNVCFLHNLMFSFYVFITWTTDAKRIQLVQCHWICSASEGSSSLW